MKRKSPSKTNLTRRTFNAGLGAAGFIAGTAPFNIVRAANAPLKVGVLLPRSGVQAGIGQDCWRGVEIAGPILKELGLPELQVMSGDTETKVDVARSRAEQLISQGAQLLIGAFNSGQTTAIAQVAEQKGVPLVINIAAAPQITEQGYKFVFRNFPTAKMILGDAFKNQKEVFAQAGAAPKSVVFLHVNDTFGTAMAKAIPAVMPHFNMPYKIVQEIPYDPAARDLSVEIAKAKASGADAILAVSRLNDSILLTREMVKQRWSPMAILSMGPGWYEDQYLKTLGKLSDGPLELRALVRSQQAVVEDAGSGDGQEISGPQPQYQPGLHLRGLADRRRRLQARRHRRPEGAGRGHPQDPHHQQCQSRRRPHVRCQGPERQAEGLRDPESRWQDGDGGAQDRRQRQGRMAAQALRQARLTLRFASMLRP